MDRFENIPEAVLAWHRCGTGAVLATVIQTWGSAPRRVGAQLGISGAGDIVGSVSGGCVEGAVAVEAIGALSEQKARVLEFGVSDGDAFAVGLACGGTIKILLEPVGEVLPADLLADLVSARHRREPTAYIVNLETGVRRLEITEQVAQFRMDRSEFLADEQSFVAIHNPPLRLVIVGAVHIAQALVVMARLAGYDPILIDPRDSFASEARFPGETMVHDWPEDALKTLGLDSRTALVLLTHDPKLDDPAIKRALMSQVFYIGALGSKRTHTKRVERLAADGFKPAQIDRIHGPIGLDIGAAGPSEIAVSIMAEITRVLRLGQ
ncbi:MAG: XdhC/CoxI family protein [Paracoccaceae bacterium]|nr:XdhC/CoxI family protein [Paracoccaceae bacterium]